MKYEIETITNENFAPYGAVISFEPDEDGFRIFVREEESPWRMAALRFSNREIKRIEKHPTSMESFEPMNGACILYVALPESPENGRAFFLDKPICLHKNIWHQVLALTPTAEVKITENLEVTGDYFDFDEDLRVNLG